MQHQSTIIHSLTPHKEYKEYIESYRLKRHQEGGVLSHLLFDASILAIGGMIVMFIVIMKSKTVSYIISDPLLFSYAYFVTTFQISRVAGALLYRRSYQSAISHPNALKNTSDGEYMPKISFVIPCMNEEKAITNTLRKCFAADYPKNLFEVIVINDGSTDNTLQRIQEVQEEYPELIVVNWTQNRGKRHGMAEGFRRAKGDIVIQLDSDSFIEPSYIRAFIEPFRNPEVGAVSAHTDPENADKNLITRMQAAYYFMSFRILKAAESSFHTVFCCSGCAAAYRRDIIAPVLDTWLQEKFLGKPVTWGDDRSLTNQVLKKGYKTLYTDKVQAYTVVPETFRQFIKQQIRWKKGWFVNSISASKFIIKRDAFVAFTYFFPLIAVTLLTPIVSARAFLYTPMVEGPGTFLFYLFGVLLVACLIMIFYRFVAPRNKYWPYLFLWAIINVLVLSYLLFFALATIQNRGWGTRGTTLNTPASKKPLSVSP